MTTTPPPPARIRARTPPTPLHGSRYDSYEPFTPRRSSRFSSRRQNITNTNTALDTPASSASSPDVHYKRATTTTEIRKPSYIRTSSQTFSPPSSPDFTFERPSPNTRSSKLRRPLLPQLGDSTPVKGKETPRLDALAPPTSKYLLDGHQHIFDPAAMFPTPSKTPRKSHVAAASNVTSTARILNFKPATLEEVMPTPRKQRKHRQLGLAPNGLDDISEEGSPSRIEIFTDTKDRVPNLDEAEDNPFVGPKKNREQSNQQRRQRKHVKVNKEREQSEREMEEAVRNDEGVLYVFRGKKVFRRFESPDSGDSNTDNDAFSETASVKRQAGASAKRPFTRSTLEPRLLFPSAEQRRHREASHNTEDDEEAPTDIEDLEAHAASLLFTSTTSNEIIGQAEAGVVPEAETTTPVRAYVRPATPPSAVRATRSSTKRAQISPLSELSPEAGGARVKRSKKSSPFDSWQRTKSVSGVANEEIAMGKKKGGEALVGLGKRTKSATIAKTM
ncbi:hypothetical protein LTR66_000051 [Elasticomyces elasticus]|nr:hypothetical protein LTR28_010587 [Elasticomyces elasticus]KAK5001174.1 hypothetical protein LTR66_000051 [Elasticomyces elasticus]